MRLLVAAIALAAATSVSAQAPDVAWPREVKGADGTVITVYQPQVESWAENNIAARAAVAVVRPGESEPTYGVIGLAARTAIDKSADVVTLTSLRVTKSSFPGATKEQAGQYLATLRGALTRQGWPVSVQALQANLAVTQARSKQKRFPVKNDPPQILFRTAPTMLVLIDGEPALRPVKDAPALARVINTAALVLQETASSTHYLWALRRWWQAKAIAGEWSPAPSPPAPVETVRAALDKQYDPLDGVDAEGKPAFDASVMPKILVATKPTELLQSKGEPQMSPIPGTQLLYMSNSDNNIFLELGAQTYYVLISGRWFSAKALAGPWSHVPVKGLPADFAKIPPAHEAADVLMSVPGTPQAREASIANEIPQTATVQRDVQPTPIVFDGGQPQWKPIDGTPLSYAPNTASPVIRVDPKSHYMVQNGVWFAASAPAGPWAVAAAVPAVIYSIPPSSPMHYVTYVRIYSSTPTTVFVGYTPGYYGTVMTTDGMVVYGTGYYYPAYVGTYWYPYPPTYGWGFGFTVGFIWGVGMGGGWHTPCCYGGGGGVYINHYNNVNINNSYNRWGGKSTSVTGPGGRNVKASQVGNTTFAKGSGSNNVYAGRDGNVYRRDGGGDWEKYQGRGNGWSDIDRPGDRPGGDRPRVDNSLPGETRDRQAEPRASQDLPRETRGSLDGQFDSRQAGNARADQLRSSGGAQGAGGFQGGGRSSGGFGGGGGRGGGRGR